MNAARALAALPLCITLASLTTAARAEERTVGPAGDYGSIQAALEDAVDGDVVRVAPGAYAEELATRAPGVTISGPGATVNGDGTVLDVTHERTVVEGLVLDGGYGSRDAVVVEASGFVLRDAEVRRSSRDCVDIRGALTGVRIERSVIHHCLRSSAAACADAGCREDAHGVVADQIQSLTLVDTEIHTFSGDALQLNGRDQAVVWGDVRLERCRLWSAPLAAAEGGYAAGAHPAENAIDTKTPDTASSPARLTVVDTVAFGFRDTLITNAAAFNLKENVEVLLDRVDVYDSEIALRLRGATSSRPRGALVTARNLVIWDVDTAVRYEDDLETVQLAHVTFGGDIGRLFQRAGAPDGAVASENVLVLAASLPTEAMGAGSLAVDASAFVDAAGHDYHLADGSAAIDVATASAVTQDRDGVARPIGAGPDVGAYERCAGASCAPPDAGPPDGGPTGSDAGPGADAGRAPGDDASVSRDAGAGVDAGGGSETEGGCGCRAAGRPGSGARSWLALVGIALLWRRARG